MNRLRESVDKVVVSEAKVSRAIADYAPTMDRGRFVRIERMVDNAAASLNVNLDEQAKTASLVMLSKWMIAMETGLSQEHIESVLRVVSGKRGISLYLTLSKAGPGASEANTPDLGERIMLSRITKAVPELLLIDESVVYRELIGGDDQEYKRKLLEISDRIRIKDMEIDQSKYSEMYNKCGTELHALRAVRRSQRDLISPVDSERETELVKKITASVYARLPPPENYVHMTLTDKGVRLKLRVPYALLPNHGVPLCVPRYATYVRYYADQKIEEEKRDDATPVLEVAPEAELRYVLPTLQKSLRIKAVYNDKNDFLCYHLTRKNDETAIEEDIYRAISHEMGCEGGSYGKNGHEDTVDLPSLSNDVIWKTPLPNIVGRAGGPGDTVRWMLMEAARGR